MFCLKHLPKKYAEGYARRYNIESDYHYGEAIHKILMTRIYIRAKTGKRGFIPFGWHCPKCNKVYSDDTITKSIKSLGHRLFTN